MIVSRETKETVVHSGFLQYNTNGTACMYEPGQIRKEAAIRTSARVCRFCIMAEKEKTKEYYMALALKEAQDELCKRGLCADLLVADRHAPTCIYPCL